MRRISRATRSASSRRRGDVAGVLDRQEAQPGAEARVLAGDLRQAVQPPLVDDLRDEPADAGMHAPRAVEEDPPVGRHGRMLAEQVLEHGGARALGWVPCETWASCCGSPSRITLRAAVPIARASASATCPASSITSASSVPSSSSRANSHTVPASSWAPAAAATNSSRSAMLRIKWLVYSVSPTPALDFLSPRKLTRSLGGLLDLVEQVVDRLVARRRHPDAPAAADRSMTIRAPVHVLPVPGGPWMTR